MKRPCRRTIALLALACWLVVTDALADWLPPEAVDLVRLLPPPPSTGSEAARRDLAAVLDWQARRSPAEADAAVADVEVSVFRYADVLGPWFSAERLPRTAELAVQLCRQSVRHVSRAKDHWRRERPYEVSAAVDPAIRNASGAAYPSGHAACGQLWAIVLADLLPARRAEIFARGRRYGEHRVVGGVHFPSDVEAGRLAATAIAAVLYTDPGFRADLERARAELRQVVPHEQAEGEGRLAEPARP